MDRFGDEFDLHFQIVPASSQDRVAECQRLRYHVFCKEHHIFAAHQYGGGLETDEFDGRSVHSLLLHRATGIPVATVRLVLGQRGRPKDKFPMEVHLGEHIYTELTGYHHAPRSTIAEISRFAVSKDFRRRVGEAKRPHNLEQDLNAAVSERGVRHHPYITLGLFKAIVQMSMDNDVRYWCAAMDPTLMRLLTRFGIRFIPIGPLTDYYGLRQPCSASVEDILNGIHEKRPDVWRFITDSGVLIPRMQASDHR